MRHRFLPLLFVLFGLAACTGPVIIGTDAAITYATKPGQAPPADTADQIPPHESWCYSTMGDAQCYTHAQNVPPDRLINVEPQSSYPVDLQAYHDAVLGRKAATAVPVMLEPGGASSLPVQKTSLDDIGGPPVTTTTTVTTIVQPAP